MSHVRSDDQPGFRERTARFTNGNETTARLQRLEALQLIGKRAGSISL
jgi:hypothetical protein